MKENIGKKRMVRKDEEIEIGKIEKIDMKRKINEIEKLLRGVMDVEKVIRKRIVRNELEYNMLLIRV